jgi:hypothetical protein
VHIGEKMTKQKIALIIGPIIVLLIAGAIGLTYTANTAENASPETSPSTTDIANSTAIPTASETPETTETNTPEVSPTQTATASSIPTSTVTATPTPTASTGNSGFSDSSNYVSYITTSNEATATVAQTLAENQNDHEDAQDYTYSTSDVITITLNGNSISTRNTACVVISGTTATIKVEGTYSISGTLNSGQIIVDAPDKAVVRLILNGASITSSGSSPIYVQNAKKAIVILASNTANTLTDSTANQNNATLYSKTDLTITGDGSLTVNGNLNDAIHGNDGVLIKSGTITVTAVDDGIVGKDYLIINGGTITVNSGGDGLTSDNDENATRGYIYITAGTLTVTATNGDGVSAQTDLLITGGSLTVTSGGGSNKAKSDLVSTKGLKGSVSVVIENGDFNINSADDAIHSNGTIILNNGDFNIATGDDGVHADTYLEVNGGAYTITKCYEGLESAELAIHNGYIQIDASDDGLNAAGGNDASSNDWFGPGGMQGRGGMPGQPGFGATGNYSLTITGGYLYIDANGDGADINGYIAMSGGVLIINGPTSNVDGAIDYDSSFTLTGGTVIAVGSAGMAMAPSMTSTVNSVLINFNTVQSAGKLVSIQSASGDVLLTFSPTKNYQSIEFSSTSLTAGTYSVYLGGTSTGTLTHSIYQDGTYSGGTQYTNFTISQTVTNVR